MNLDVIAAVVRISKAPATKPRDNGGSDRREKYIGMNNPTSWTFAGAVTTTVNGAIGYLNECRGHQQKAGTDDDKLEADSQSRTFTEKVLATITFPLDHEVPSSADHDANVDKQGDAHTDVEMAIAAKD